MTAHPRERGNPVFWAIQTHRWPDDGYPDHFARQKTWIPAFAGMNGVWERFRSFQVSLGP